jgi:hypothetical protein
MVSAAKPASVSSSQVASRIAASSSAPRRRVGGSRPSTADVRQLWANPNPAASVHAWPMQQPVWASLAWSAALLAVFAPLAARLYRRRTLG